TIIAFPIPQIGERFEEIFEETIKINTLDYQKYRDIQQTIIDTLDKASYVRVKGCGENKTSLTVALWKLKNPEKETIFENCVADVNIPVGEVFTSPVLKGTNGVLHVTEVFLNGLQYKDLSLTFEDGMVTEYSCSNFKDSNEGKKYIKDHVLHQHDTLPMGEFAIGTNTVAYVVSKKYGISNVMPILIAEKTGPHFAVGDTCYSHEEDIMTYNPDKKAIVARENEVSALRKSDPAKAYLNCHTDITIPYDELGELTAVTQQGEEYPIIRNGRFVLPGTQELNKPFDE
ncbi:MAG: aminopeptidase, partial [Lachnospiraceae bacterium]